MAGEFAQFNEVDQASIQATWGVMPNNLVNRLVEVEGWEVTPYVPNVGGKVLGHSGVSIGNGVDFGQWTPQSFLDAGVPPALVDRAQRLKLFGVQGQDALNLSYKVNQEYGNLPFSDGEVSLMSNLITGAVENDVRGWLQPGQYDGFTQDEQTAVMSLAHLYGVPKLKTHKNASKFIQEENWGALYGEMRNYGDANSQKRHSRMAEYLVPSVNRGYETIYQNTGSYEGMKLAGVALDAPISTLGIV